MSKIFSIAVRVVILASLIHLPVEASVARTLDKEPPSKIGDAFVIRFEAPFTSVIIQTDEKNVPNPFETEILITPNTKIKSKGKKFAGVEDITVGANLKIKTDKNQFPSLVAKEIEIEDEITGRSEKVDGYLDRVKDERAVIDGRALELAPGVTLKGEKEWDKNFFNSFEQIPLGSLLDVEGVRRADGVVEVRSGSARPNLYTKIEKDLADYVADGLTVSPDGKGASIKVGDRYLKLVENLDVTAYVNRVGSRVVPRFLRYLSPEDPNKVNFRFYVIDDDTPNASAVSDGSVFINKGLLARLQNEAQLAIVLGHEISHVTNEHVRRNIEANRKVSFWMALLGIGSSIFVGENLAKLIAMTTFELSMNKFNSDLEEQADRVGMFYAYDAGYDVREAASVWKQLIGEYKDYKKGRGLYSDHPSMMSRLKDSRKEIISNYRNVEFNEAIIGREEYLEGVGVFFGWVQPKPEPTPEPEPEPEPAATPAVPSVIVTDPSAVKKEEEKKPTRGKKGATRTSKTAIRRFNFKNYTYDNAAGNLANAGFQAEGKPSRDRYVAGRYRKGDFRSNVTSVNFVDLTGDGIEEAVVIIYSEITGQLSPFFSKTVYVFQMSGSRPSLVFRRGLFKGEISLEGTTIKTEASYWAADDGFCCPTQGHEKATYAWDGQSFVQTSRELDPK